ncbi:hypothetical protein BC830DRAFT_556496 [Chytriomyces sp. MP71]|nr:hypothetical protein BC830DRAFT_556496 [Chytriomyces sp. MP71]
MPFSVQFRPKKRDSFNAARRGTIQHTACTNDSLSPWHSPTQSTDKIAAKIFDAANPDTRALNPAVASMSVCLDELRKAPLKIVFSPRHSASKLALRDPGRERVRVCHGGTEESEVEVEEAVILKEAAEDGTIDTQLPARNSRTGGRRRLAPCLRKVVR